ncbi:MAG: hypothetical protein LC642_06980, partial [Verrucomicrobiaceae bacterium]|nr:hypothetical protein [Verrucomicrobiaceae bacterium]
VNNSLIEAVYHLSQQTQEMMQEINQLRRSVASLRKQLAATSGARAATPPGLVTESEGATETETSIHNSARVPQRPSSCE